MNPHKSPKKILKPLYDEFTASVFTRLEKACNV
jgi:hypothetical protein